MSSRRSARWKSHSIIVLTAHSSIINVVEAMRAGATDFLVKPASAEKIRTAIASSLANGGLVGDLEGVTEAVAGAMSFKDLVGASPTMIEAVETAKRAAATTVPVLIDGESGVGKELFARSIQAESDRAAAPFIRRPEG